MFWAFRYTSLFIYTLLSPHIHQIDKTLKLNIIHFFHLVSPYIFSLRSMPKQTDGSFQKIYNEDINLTHG